MPTEIRREIHTAELAEIVQAVFGTMMDLPIRQCTEPWLSNRDRLTSVVHLTGDWSGAVMLECTRVQACAFALRFVSGDANSGEVDDVVRDVLGELANMIGGNLKCVLTRGTRLSMPSVIDGDYSLRVCGAEIRERLAFACAEGVFWITVLATRT